MKFIKFSSGSFLDYVSLLIAQIVPLFYASIQIQPPLFRGKYYVYVLGIILILILIFLFKATTSIKTVKQMFRACSIISFAYILLFNQTTFHYEAQRVRVQIGCGVFGGLSELGTQILESESQNGQKASVDDLISHVGHKPGNETRIWNSNSIKFWGNLLSIVFLLLIFAWGYCWTLIMIRILKTEEVLEK